MDANIIITSLEYKSLANICSVHDMYINRLTLPRVRCLLFFGQDPQSIQHIILDYITLNNNKGSAIFRTQTSVHGSQRHERDAYTNGELHIKGTGAPPKGKEKKNNEK